MLHKKYSLRLHKLTNNPKLDKRDDLQTVNRTVGIVLGVLLGVFLVTALISLYIWRCTCTQRRHWSRSRPAPRHRRLRKLLAKGTSQTISSRDEGRAGEPGGYGGPGGRGRPGGRGQRIVGVESSLNDNARRDDGGDSAVRGQNIDGSFGAVQGGPGIGGSAYGGEGGQGGNGGHGGVGGCGGNGGQASARAEAYASVYTLFMCCVQTPPKKKGPKGRPPYWVGAPGPPGPPGRPEIGRPWPGMPGPQGTGGGGEHGLPGDQGIQTIIVEGGAGSGGIATGGKGGYGGRGGLGGNGGQGGRGGQGTAHASASTPIHPGLMCCVLVRTYP